MTWYGIEPLAAVDDHPSEALVLARMSNIERLTRFVYRRLAKNVDRQHELVHEIEVYPARRELLIDELVRSVREEPRPVSPRNWPALYARLESDPDPSIRDQALELALSWGDQATFEPVRAIVVDSSSVPERRTRGIEALIRGRDSRTGPLLLAMLDDGVLRAQAIRGLAAFTEQATPDELLARFPSFSSAERREAVATLCSRVPWAQRLLAAVGDGRVERNELSAYQLRALWMLGDAEIYRLLDRHVGSVRPSRADKEMEMERVRALLDAKESNELARGRELFERTCQRCHVLFGTGGTLGPELTGANRSDLEYLLSNVIDPSGVVANEYRTTIARLLDGRLVTGVERARTASAVTLETETGRVTLALDETEELELSPLSTMPEGLLDALGEDEVRALFAYLRSPAQAPLLATPVNVSGFFDGKTLAGWRGDPSVWSVEGGAIVGRTDGLARNEFLKSDYELGDFRLSLEVRLAGDAGNSGIQFRSREVEGGDVAGYQADIGPGWWGKLYEEHGRAVLVERGATRVVRDGWNRYVIECKGSRVRTWLEDEPCVDLDDPAGARAGIVALQVHSGGPTEVRFRNLELELLP
jgi:putative heme-binding domain-containing protein